jgi:hypothetical protein
MRSRYRFGVRALLILTAMVAAALWLGREWIEWRRWQPVREQLAGFMKDEQNGTNPFEMAVVVLHDGRWCWIAGLEIGSSGDKSFVRDPANVKPASGGLFIAPPYRWVRSADEAIAIWKRLPPEQYTTAFESAIQNSKPNAN